MVAGELRVRRVTALALRRAFGLAWLRWAGFRLVDAVSNIRSRLKGRILRRKNSVPAFGRGVPSVWVFVSTIGELNSVTPVLRELSRVLKDRSMTLLTDRTIYRQSFQAAFPGAYVYEMDGTAADVNTLVKMTPPAALLLAEIPCFPSDAPCRLSYQAVWEAKRHGAPVVLFNAWNYEYQPTSMADRLERWLVGRDFLRAMDLITVQSNVVRDRLVGLGAPAERIYVTGNTKFDALDRAASSIRSEAARDLARVTQAASRAVVVAGCVTDDADQELIIDAFAEMRRRLPDALLVLAPRHPEQPGVVSGIARRLDAAGCSYVLRSESDDMNGTSGRQCLVLDTIGELKDFYSVSSVAYVGRDHNVLEPLAYGKVVTVSPGWETRYPSYPVYRRLLEERLLEECSSAQALAVAWTRAFDSERPTAITSLSSRLGGATGRNLDLITPLLETAALDLRETKR